jgi:hypothetical protein
MALQTANQFQLGTDFSRLGSGIQQGQQIANQFQIGQQNKAIGEQNNAKFNQEQSTIRATVLNKLATSMKGVPEEQRHAFLKNQAPELKKFNIDAGIFAQELLDDASLDEAIAGTQSFISQEVGPSALEQAQTAKTVKQTELLGIEKPVNQLDQAKIDKIRKEIELNPESDDLKRQEFELKKQIELRQSTKLSAGLEKALIESQDRVVEAQRNSTEFDILAKQVVAADLSGGIQSTTNETFKALLGTQDDVTEFRRRFNSVRLSEGLKNLPPGPATDKDMEQAFKGVPPENAPASQIASFLRGAAKMARFDAGYNQFKADFISENSTSKGMNKEWRKTVTSTVLDRTITIAEIYAEAAAEGMTPEDVKAELGIE